MARSPDVTVDFTGELGANNVDNKQQKLVLRVWFPWQLPRHAHRMLSLGGRHDGGRWQQSIPIASYQLQQV